MAFRARPDDVTPASRNATQRVPYGELRETVDRLLQVALRLVAAGDQQLDLSPLLGLGTDLQGFVVELQRFGKVDILINCAGIIKRMPTLTMPEEEWADILNTNLTGTLRACQIFGKHMLERGYGRVVNVASLNSFVALTEVAAYAASKSGVVSLTRSLAVEWSKKGVTVNAIAPGVFRTALNADLLDNAPRGQELLMRTPMGRFGRTEELVGAAVYLCSDAASFVTGETLVIDGGFLASGVNQ